MFEPVRGKPRGADPPTGPKVMHVQDVTSKARLQRSEGMFIGNASLPERSPQGLARCLTALLNERLIQ